MNERQTLERRVAPFPAWRRLCSLAAGVSLGLAVGREARAQLAITEVMSWASTNCLGGFKTPNADFWELTNFGTNWIDLTGYRFADRGKDYANAVPLDGLSIAPGESMIFVRTRNGTVDAAAFRVWWGEANLPPDLQIVFYPSGYSFGDQGDAALLWDAQTNVVDKAVFGEATRGVTFTFDTCGHFGAKSQLGVCGAFRAVECEDIGSPGSAPCGPIPLSISRQPASQTVDPGMDFTFSVEACGLPRPKCQWYFNGSAISNDLAIADSFPTVVNFAGCGPAWNSNTTKATDLIITNVQPAHAGQYFVVLTNGIERLTSAVVTLTVNTNPSPPWIECPPSESRWPAFAGHPQTDLTVTPGQTASFAVIARGYPPPLFEWSWSADGTDFTVIPSATNRVQTIPNVPSHLAGTYTYRVRVQNSMGTCFADVRFSVKPKPLLKITEVMTSPCDNAHPQWWELTNEGDEPVNLYGYRWDDLPGNIGGGPTVTNRVIIRPGESVIFLQDWTREAFVHWWGEDKLPPNLQFIVYTANDFSGHEDEITVWNPTATDNFDWIGSAAFSMATRGASFWFQTNWCVESEFGVPSVEGQCSAFRAAETCDVGSPGWTPWTPWTPPRLTEIWHQAPFAPESWVLLRWKATPGSINRLQYARYLAAPPSATVWTDVGTYSFPGATGAAIDFVLDETEQRFYRLVRDSPGDCECPPW